ncbi:MAG: cytochrome c [Bacteroidia bacterium]
MKKLFIYSFFLFFTCVEFYSCDDSAPKQNAETSVAKAIQDTATKYASGKVIFEQTCITCHQFDGKGVAGTYPPLAQSDYLLADKQRAIQQVLQGSNKLITVNGNTFTSLMPPQELSDLEIADVLNYVYHTWGNNGYTVSSEDVKVKRIALKEK